MGRGPGTALAGVVIALALAPAADAAPAWTCGASAGWLASAGTRTDAPGPGGEPCPQASAAAAPASNGGGNLTASGTLAVDGGPASQTTDTRRPRATADAKSLTIRSADGKLVVDAQKLHAEAEGGCDANRAPQLTSASALGNVMLNGRHIDSGSDYSEPGVGVNGAPLFGKITIKFGEVVASDAAVVRRALHVIVTDRDGNVVFEAVGGEVSVGRDGTVCDPPPICPPGTEPRDGRCVTIEVTPLPVPPAPVPPGAPGASPQKQQPKAKPRSKKRRRRGCTDTTARVRHVSNRRLAAATLCLMNLQRRRRHLRPLRMSNDLSLAAARHARSMVAGRYFSHDEPGGPGFLDRVLHSGYLARYGRWRIGENLGWGWGPGGTPRALVAAWMRSRQHRRNILNPRFHDVGIAVRPGSPRQSRRSQPATYVIDFGGFVTPSRHA
jgi:uncharacterized protein YkwD